MNQALASSTKSIFDHQIILESSYKSIMNSFKGIKDKLHVISADSGPLTDLLAGADLCKKNIEEAEKRISEVCSQVNEAESACKIIRSKINLGEIDNYVKAVEDAYKLKKRFIEDLPYFKESFMLSERLETALEFGKKELEHYFHELSKKLVKYLEYLEENTGQQQVLELSEMLKKITYALDLCRSQNYFNSFKEQRSLKVQAALDLVKQKASKIDSKSPVYEKNSYYLISFISALGSQIKFESQLLNNLFSSKILISRKLEQIIEKPLNFTHEKIENIIIYFKEQNPGLKEVLILINILECILANLRPFQDDFEKNGKFIDKVEEEIELLEEAIIHRLDINLEDSKAEAEEEDEDFDPSDEQVSKLLEKNFMNLSEIDKYEKTINFIISRYKINHENESPFDNYIEKTIELVIKEAQNKKDEIIKIFFEINSLSYIFTKSNAIKKLLNPEIMKKISSEVNNLKVKYLKLYWENFPQMFDLEAIHLEGNKTEGQKELRNRLKEINKALRKISKKQNGLILQDFQIAQDIKKNIINYVIYPFSKMIETINSSSNAQYLAKYLKYDKDELLKLIDNLFIGDKTNNQNSDEVSELKSVSSKSNK